MFPLKKLFLKWQYTEHLIYIPLKVLDAIFLPRPYLRCYVIECTNMRQPLFYIFRNLQIETCIIHQYHHVWLPLANILLTQFHPPHYLWKMQQHWNEPHVRQLTIMHHQMSHVTCRSKHIVSSEETKLCLRVFLYQRCHEVSGMQIARCLTCDDIILHNTSFCELRNS